jgi:hypothetical protein
VTGRRRRFYELPWQRRKLLDMLEDDLVVVIRDADGVETAYQRGKDVIPATGEIVPWIEIGIRFLEEHARDLRAALAEFRVDEEPT